MILPKESATFSSCRFNFFRANKICFLSRTRVIRILKHGKRAKSLIKYGLEEIANVLLKPLYKPKFDVFKFLSCTYISQ